MGINLTYSTYSCILPSPDLDDILRFSSQAVNRQLKGGLPKIFKDPLWPVIEIRQYSIRNCTLSQITDFENLYRAAIGLTITLQESYGVSLTGLIMNPTIEILTLDDRDCGSYDLEFEFLATVISYLTGDCNLSIVTPEYGDSNYNRTLDNDLFENLYFEDGDFLYTEAGQQLFIESS